MKKFLSFGVGYAGLDNEITVVWNDGSASYFVNSRLKYLAKL